MLATRQMRLLAVVLGSAAALALTGCDPVPGRIKAGPVMWVSADREGRQAPLGKSGEDISRNGRFVVVQHVADLGGDDTNGGAGVIGDVFVRDRHSGALELISVGIDGRAGNGDSHDAAFSGDGRFVAFSSYASDLVEGDTNETRDVFVRDRTAGTTSRVTRTAHGGEAGSLNDAVQDISADGRWVLFTSSSSPWCPAHPSWVMASGSTWPTASPVRSAASTGAPRATPATTGSGGPASATTAGTWPSSDRHQPGLAPGPQRPARRVLAGPVHR